MESHLEIKADQDPQTIRAVIETAEKMSFLLDSIERPHEVSVARRSTVLPSSAGPAAVHHPQL